eukprot:scaffold63149_cov53-Phaeocystis_antarctica.AAC.4
MTPRVAAPSAYLWVQAHIADDEPSVRARRRDHTETRLQAAGYRLLAAGWPLHGRARSPLLGGGSCSSRRLPLLAPPRLR